MKNSLLYTTGLVALAYALPGCRVVGGIFKAGVWVGGLIVLGVALVIGVVFAALRRA
jgi:hypothetical protein